MPDHLDEVRQGRYEPDVAYFRRRADSANDERLRRLEGKVDGLDSKVDILTVRMAIVGAVVTIVIVTANIIGPVIAQQLIRGG